MTTKAQERKALEQIRKIVEGLGEDSYIGMAFEGCFEIAEENIENDWGCSMKQNFESAVKEQGKLREIAAELQEENRKFKARAEKAENLYNTTQKSADSWCAKYHEAADSATENWNKFREMEDKVEALELENMKLKAKLYDMMVGA